MTVGRTEQKAPLDLFDYLDGVYEYQEQYQNRLKGKTQPSYNFEVGLRRRDADNNLLFYKKADWEVRLAGSGGRTLQIDVNPNLRTYSRFAQTLSEAGYFKKSDLSFDCLTGQGWQTTDGDASQEQIEPVRPDPNYMNTDYLRSFRSLLDQRVSFKYLARLTLRSNPLVSFQHFFSLLLTQADAQTREAIALSFRLITFTYVSNYNFDQTPVFSPPHSIEEANLAVNSIYSSLSEHNWNEIKSNITYSNYAPSLIANYLVLLASGVSLSENEQKIYAMAVQHFMQNDYVDKEAIQKTNNDIGFEYDISRALDYVVEHFETPLNEYVRHEQEFEVPVEEAMLVTANRTPQLSSEELSDEIWRECHSVFPNSLDAMADNLARLAQHYELNHDFESLQKAFRQSSSEAFKALKLDPFVLQRFYSYLVDFEDFAMSDINRDRGHVSAQHFLSRSEQDKEIVFCIDYQDIQTPGRGSLIELLVEMLPVVDEVVSDTVFPYRLTQNSFSDCDLLEQLVDEQDLYDRALTQQHRQRLNKRINDFVKAALRNEFDQLSLSTEHPNTIFNLISFLGDNPLQNWDMIQDTQLWQKGLDLKLPLLHRYFSALYAGAPVNNLPRLRDMWIRISGKQDNDMTSEYYEHLDYQSDSASDEELAKLLISSLIESSVDFYAERMIGVEPPCVLELLYAKRTGDTKLVEEIIRQVNDDYLVPQGYAVILITGGPDQKLAFKQQGWGKFIFLPVKLVEQDFQASSPDTGLFSFWNDDSDELMVNSKVKTYYFSLAFDEFPEVAAQLNEYTVSPFMADDFYITPHVNVSEYFSQDNLQSFSGPKINLDFVEKQAVRLEKIVDELTFHRQNHPMTAFLMRTGPRDYADYYSALLTEASAHENAHLVDPQTVGTIDQEVFASLMGIAYSSDPYIVLYRFAENIFDYYKDGDVKPGLKPIIKNGQSTGHYVIEQQHGRGCSFFFEQVGREIGVLKQQETLLDLYKSPTVEFADRYWDALEQINTTILTWSPETIKQKAREYAWEFKGGRD